MLCKSMDWFLYDTDFCHERVEEEENWLWLVQDSSDPTDMKS